MALGSCYRASIEQKTRMFAELTCRKEGGTLAKPRMDLNMHLLNELARKADFSLPEDDRKNSKFWIGFHRDLDLAENPYNVFTNEIQGTTIKKQRL